MLKSSLYLTLVSVLLCSSSFAEEYLAHRQVKITTPVTHEFGVSLDYSHYSIHQPHFYEDAMNKKDGSADLVELELGISGLNDKNKRITGHFRRAHSTLLGSKNDSHGALLFNTLSAEATPHNVRVDTLGFIFMDIGHNKTVISDINMLGYQQNRDQHNRLLRFFAAGYQILKKGENFTLNGSANTALIMGSEDQENEVSAGIDFKALGGINYRMTNQTGPYISAQIEGQAYMKEMPSIQNNIQTTISTGIGGVF